MVTETLQPSWHDNIIYGFHFISPDVETGDWRSELLLDIDHIVEWTCGADGGVKFRVAPATLVFHHVTNLRIDVNFDDGGPPQTMNQLSIQEITRAPIVLEHAAQPYEYYQWVIKLNLPSDGEIAFGANQFTQTLRDEPVLLDEQFLRASQRVALDLGKHRSAEI